MQGYRSGIIKEWKLLFLLRSSKKSESPRYSLFVFVLCCRGFVVGVLLGRQGSVFSTHASSNKALFCGEAKMSARATQSLKTNTTRGIKSGIIVVVVLMNNRCLELN